MEETPSKKDLKKQKRLAELEYKTEMARQNTIKWIAIGIVAALFVGFFAFLVFSIKKNKQQVATTQISRDGWVRGSGKTTLVEYGDFQCPACKAYEPIVEQLMHDFNGRVKLIFKNFPLTQVHKNALAAAQFAEAAGKQGKFWQIHDLLYKNQDEWGESDNAQSFFDKYAQTLKLDVNKIHDDAKSSAVTSKIQSNEDDGINIGVDATPTFYLNNVKLDNPGNYSDFKQTIQKVVDNNK